MNNITEKIKSLRETVGVEYKRPEFSKVVQFQEALKGSEVAQKYLHDRGLTDTTIQHFGLGYDSERSAISIPVYKSGQLINIKYRFLDSDRGKYGSESGAETWMFNDEGLQEGIKKKGILIVEGEFDCMAVWQMGVTNVISPASGKDSFGPWLEFVSAIPRIWIAYDNDEPGQKSAKKLAERLGSDKCFCVQWPQKDANDFLLAGNGRKEIIELIQKAKTFLVGEFKTLGDIINTLRSGEKFDLQTRYIPEVKFKNGWMAMISGRQNVGKTAYVMNIAKDIASQGIGVLVEPFERGIESVGERLLHIVSENTEEDMSRYSNEDWDGLIRKVADLPIYFALPDIVDNPQVIEKSARFLNIKVVIIDHLDYLVRNAGTNRESAISDTLKALKHVAEEFGLILIVVSHLRKLDAPGAFIARSRKPNIEDLKGSSSLYQDPEVVVLLSENSTGGILVDVQKNKGPMTERIFNFDPSTGLFDDNQATVPEKDDEIWSGNW